MCPPGRFAPQPQSPQCSPCGNGTYANSWGSSHCKQCISGTFSASEVRLEGFGRGWDECVHVGGWVR